MNILEDSWHRVTDGRARKSEFYDLVCRYSDTRRCYHTLEHIRDMLQGLYATDQYSDPTLHRAIWWHDAIYDSTRSDNEEQSADLAVRTLMAWHPGTTDKAAPAIVRVGELILMTKRHEVPQDDIVAQTLVDLDLCILASQSEKYDLYAVNVREEYAWVSDNDYALGRSDFLMRMLARDHIFADSSLDKASRANMSRELSSRT